jgi:hypothetical protein
MVLTKRLLIKRLLLNLVRYPKEYAVATYIKERYNLYQEFSMQSLAILRGQGERV